MGLIPKYPKYPLAEHYREDFRKKESRGQLSDAVADYLTKLLRQMERDYINIARGITDAATNVTNEADPIFANSVANSIVANDVNNWDAAYGWGDHSAAGYVSNETDPLFANSAANGIVANDVNNWNAAYSWGNHADAGYLSNETDPIFANSAANGITANDLANWNAAYAWGNHADEGYLTNETDPLFANSAANGITANDVNNWDSAYSWGNHADAGYVESETDPLFSNSAANGISSNDLANWNAAYSWGNHADAGYLSNESDPLFVNSVANGISSNDVNNWNSAYAWGNHADAGYVSNESDPLFANSAANGITANDVNNWDSAYGWGNHADAGYLSNESDPIFANSAANGIVANDISEWNSAYSWGNHADAGYLTVESDPLFANSAANGIVANDVNNWNSAYAWGNHADEGYLTVESDPIFANSAANGISSNDVLNWNAAHSWGNHADAGYLTGITGEALGDLSDVNTANAANGQVLKYNAGSWAPANDLDTTYVSSDFDHNALANYDVNEHRKINDAGVASTDLWSASHISNEVGNVAGALLSHANDANNPHEVTKAQVGLANVPDEDATDMSNWDQSNAANGEVPTWVTANSAWEPAAVQLNISDWGTGVNYSETELVWAPDCQRYVSLSGTSSGIEILSNSGFDIDGDLTVEFWMRLKAWPSSHTTVVGRLTDDANNMFHLRMSNSAQGHWYCGDGANAVGLVTWNPSNSVELNRWVHIAGVREVGVQNRLIINGVEEANANCANVTVATPAANIYIMKDYSQARYLEADVFGFRLWNVARTANQVLANMHNILPGNTANLLINIPVTEASGTVVNDLSANDFNGTVANGSWSQNYRYSLFRAAEVHTSGVFLNDLNDLKWRETSYGADITSITTNVTYEIPGDYATLQEAIDELSQYPIAHGVTVTLNISTGHALTKGLKLKNGDYGQFRITSTDAVVYLDASIVWVSNSPSGPAVPGSSEILFLFDNCVAPSFEILVDMEGSGQHGYSIINNASGYVAADCGVKNCGWHNLVMASNARLVCNYAIWTGAGLTGMYIQVNSDCIGNYANASDPSGANGKCVHCSRNSRLYFNYGEACNSNSHGVEIRRSRIQMEYANVTGSNGVGVRAIYASMVSAYGVDVSNSGNYGMLASQGSVIDATNATAANTTAAGFAVYHGGVISCYGSNGTKSANVNTLTANGIIYGEE